MRVALRLGGVVEPGMCGRPINMFYQPPAALDGKSDFKADGFIIFPLATCQQKRGPSPAARLIPAPQVLTSLPWAGRPRQNIRCLSSCLSYCLAQRVAEDSFFYQSRAPAPVKSAPVNPCFQQEHFRAGKPDKFAAPQAAFHRARVECEFQG